MNAWWKALSRREQFILSSSVLILIFIVMDTLWTEKYQMEDAQLSEQINKAKQDLLWMKQNSFRVASISTNKKNPIKGSFVSYVNSQLTRSGLSNQLQQMTPIDTNTVRLNFNDINFNRLLAFLSVVDESIHIKEVRLLAVEAPGMVNARLLLTIESSLNALEK